MANKMDAKTQEELSLALFDAARSGDIETIQSLLAAGTDVNARGGKGETALMCAAENRNADAFEIVKLAACCWRRKVCCFDTARSTMMHPSGSCMGIYVFARNNCRRANISTQGM